MKSLMLSRGNMPTTASPDALSAARLLRERINAGEYQAGEWLPTERELTTALNVQRRALRAAIAQLEHEGLLVRQPNCRPVVQPPAEKQYEPPKQTQFPSSKLVALIMFHGGPLEQASSAQQRIFWGMNQALGNAGYHTVFLDLGESIGETDENAAREAAHLRYIIDHNFGGAIFYPYAYDSNHDLIREVARTMPLVLIDRMFPAVEADYVGVQNYQAFYDATKYLIDQGHQRIAYITKNEPINPVQDRLQGYIHAMHDTFHSDRHEMVLSIPSFGGQDWPIFDIVFDQAPEQRPTAAVCVNDYDAVKVFERLKLLNLRVPEDVSIIGCDDIIQHLPTGVGLTTLAQPFENIGREAARLFVDHRETRRANVAKVELPAKLIVRDSVVGV